MRNIFTSFLFFILTTLVHSQSFQKISSGAGYNKQSFVRLGDNSEKLVDNNAWDIAFTAFGFQDAGIFINESSGSSMGQNLPLAELYYALTDDFNAAINLDALKDYKLLNSEISWKLDLIWREIDSFDIVSESKVTKKERGCEFFRTIHEYNSNSRK